MMLVILAVSRTKATVAKETLQKVILVLEEQKLVKPVLRVNIVSELLLQYDKSFIYLLLVWQRTL